MSRSSRRRGDARGDDSQRSTDDRGSEDRAVAGAGGVVFDPQGNVLLLRHASGNWVFPKGHIEPGEGPLDTAIREIEEEAGVRARCDDPATSWTTRYRNARGELREITWYRMHTQAETPVLRERLFPDGAFLPSGEAARRLSFSEDRRLLALVLDTGANGHARPRRSDGAGPSGAADAPSRPGQDQGGEDG